MCQARQNERLLLTLKEHFIGACSLPSLNLQSSFRELAFTVNCLFVYLFIFVGPLEISVFTVYVNTEGVSLYLSFDNSCTLNFSF